MIQQAGSVALEDRCKGVKDNFPNTENIQVNGADDSAVTSSIQAKLSQDKAIDWVITLGAAQALDTIKAIPAAGSKAKVGTFDLNIDAAQAMKDGKLQFCHRPAALPPGLPGDHASSTCTRRTATSWAAAAPC